MSGIAGIYYLDGQPVQYSDLARMTDVLSHRGPDGAEIWCGGSVGLGHRMLWTTPESLLEKLPLVKGNLTLTADARIDNREELIPALGFADYPADKVTDSDLILAAYEKWGTQCPEKLLGDFAFVIWDGRNQQLFCARDHFGVKPLYYYHQPGKLFAFASEIKALLALSDVPWQINEVRIADYLLQRYEDKASTFYQHIYRCVPAHSLRVTAEQLSLHLYWQLDPHRELRLSSDEEYAAAYREIFTEAVRCRLRSAFPIGSMLSGGLDSSSIVCTAHSLWDVTRGDSLKTFSAIFDTVPESDERFYIQTVLEQGNFESHYIHGDQLSFLDSITLTLPWQDEPFDAPNSLINLETWRIAQQQGVRVLLDGLMGDNVISHGYAYLNELARTGQWLTLATEIRALAKQRNRSPWAPIRRFIWNDGVKSNIPPALRQRWRQLRGYQEPVWKPDPLLNPEFTRQVGLKERVQEFAAGEWRTERENHHQELNSGFVPLSMEMFNKGVSAYAIEARLPFTDRRLVEFCLAVPANQKLHRGWSRVIARRAMENCLPKAIQWRHDKGDLGVNLIRRILTEQSKFEEFMQNYPAELEAYIDISTLRKISQQFLAQGEHYQPGKIHQLLLVITLAHWLRYVKSSAGLVHEAVFLS
ncbi:MAG: lasso peptide isopeptide bond-forming cyclase [Elainella sp. C42_A2020_010]|nr:lasso peptide isopeptide bond-forming cyclase [Elainella sp. C42_A2020_010]